MKTPHLKRIQTPECSKPRDGFWQTSVWSLPTVALQVSSINMFGWEHVPFQKPSIASQVSTVGTWWLSLVGDRFNTERQSICFSKWLLLQSGGAPYVPGKPQNSTVLPCWPCKACPTSNPSLKHLYSPPPPGFQLCLRSSLASQYDITPYLVLLYRLPWFILFPPFPLSCVIWHVCTCMHACMCMHGAALDGCWNCPAFLPCCFEARSLNQSQTLLMQLISLDALGNSPAFWSWNNRQAATPAWHVLGSGNPSLGPFACTGRHFNHWATCLIPLPAFYSYSYMTHSVTYSLHCSLLPLQALWC